MSAFPRIFLLIISIPPILLELISGVYGFLSIRAYYNRSRLEPLDENHNILNLNPDRYIRLICFSAVDLLCGIPITVFYLYANVAQLVSFTGLTKVHYQFVFIYQLPAAVWRSNTLSELSYEMNRWIIVYVAFAYFAIFGFTKESRNNYRAVYRAVLQFVVQVFVKITGINCRFTSNKAEGCVTSSFISFFV